MANSFLVKIDTHEYHYMLVRFNKDKVYRFRECGNGLYFLDISDPEIILIPAKYTAVNYSF